MHALAEWNMIGRRLFNDIEPIGNIFYLHEAIIEVPKQRFIIKPPGCWGMDLLTEIYQLLLMFGIISPWSRSLDWRIPANTYLLKVNNSYTRKRRKICSKLTIKTPEWCHWRRSGVLIVNFKHISLLFLVFLLLTLNKKRFVGTLLKKVLKKCENKYLDEVFSGQNINFKLLVEHSNEYVALFVIRLKAIFVLKLLIDKTFFCRLYWLKYFSMNNILKSKETNKQFFSIKSQISNKLL